jgi:hypothetical protein
MTKYVFSITTILFFLFNFSGLAKDDNRPFSTRVVIENRTHENQKYISYDYGKKF